MTGVRLQKILAAAGVASRRKAEELIAAGRVQVNGAVITELGTRADPDKDHVRVDGKLLQGPERHRYFVLNKPHGYVTTVSDPEGRPKVADFFKRSNARLFPVGRLDFNSEGLLVMTNDGELANLLTRASSGVEKVYLVKVSGKPTDEGIAQLRAGIEIERGRIRPNFSAVAASKKRAMGAEVVLEKVASAPTYAAKNMGKVKTAPAAVRLVRDAENPWYEVTLTEGRNRQLRKMFEEIGHHVEKIRRIGYGPLQLDVKPGEIRELLPDEVEQLRAAANGKAKKSVRPIGTLRKPKVKQKRHGGIKARARES